MPTDYTDPATIDVGVVVGNIGHDHRTRGHLWTDEPTWPSVTVAALAAALEEAEAARDEWRTIADRLASAQTGEPHTAAETAALSAYAAATFARPAPSTEGANDG